MPAQVVVVTFASTTARHYGAYMALEILKRHPAVSVTLYLDQGVAGRRGFPAAMCYRAASLMKRMLKNALQQAVGRNPNLSPADPVLFPVPPPRPALDGQYLEAAQQQGIRIVTAKGLQTPEGLSILEKLNPDFVAYFGGIVRKSALERIQGRFINAHGGGKLPDVRGSDSMEWSLVANRPLWVNTHFIDAGVDTGPILLQRSLDVLPDEDYGRLYARRDLLRAELMVDTIGGLADGTLQPHPQSLDEGTTYYSMHPILKAFAYKCFLKRQG